ncbi:MAG: 3-hydroxyacyl-CoA dehydrogenase [Kineosporiaceae bacterium]|nr:3-hydroxyacyl-CoA dehydrogenase [Aeromicrobium sp.]
MYIRIIGAGVMGRGIAQWAAVAGNTVELADARPESVREACTFIEDMLDRAVAKQRMSAEAAAAACGRLIPLPTFDAPGDQVELVIEAIHEDLQSKIDLFRRLEQVLPATAVFSTNTSSLSVTRIAAGLDNPERLIGLHFFNPAPLMKIVEVIPGVHTRPGIAPELVEFVSHCGHRAVVVADSPGFLVNHSGRGLITGALALLEESVAGVETIDRIARDVLGLRMGPFELTDLTGLDVTASVITTIWSGFADSDRLRPSYLTDNRVAAGLLGRKTGRGFYDYGTDEGARPVEPVIAGDSSRPVWVTGDGSHAAELRLSLSKAGATFEDGDRASAEAIVLVPTWGTTVAAAVAAQGLPPARTLGFDPLSLATSRRVLALTPATDLAVARDAAAVLARTENVAVQNRVSLVHDTPGSVAQRLLSSIVSVAASIAERSIATPTDIDDAVTAGLGYPHGPLAWGDRIGAAQLLDLQQSLHRNTGDQRYRPTRWVTERAQLGLPLIHQRKEIAS